MTDLLGKITGIFSTREEEVHVNASAEFYREERQKEIQQAEQKAEQLMKETEQVLEDLKSGLEGLKDYEDSKGIQAVEDVADNFYSDRSRMIDSFQHADDIERHADNLEGFVEGFNDVSQKEGQVLNYIEKRSGELPGRIQELTQHHQKVQEFLENDYRVVRKHTELRDKVEELEEARERIEEIEKELEDLDIQGTETEKRQKIQEIDELEKSDKWKEKEAREQKIQELKEDKKQIASELSRQVSRIERSLKKIIYNVEHENVEFDADVDKLRKLADQKFSELQDVEKTMDEAGRVLEENDIVKQSQQERFEEASEKLAHLDDKKDRMQSLADQIRDLEQELEGMDVQDTRQELEEQRDRLESRIEQKEEKKDELEQEIDRIRSQIERLEHDIEDDLKGHLSFEVELKTD